MGLSLPFAIAEDFINLVGDGFFGLPDETSGDNPVSAASGNVPAPYVGDHEQSVGAPRHFVRSHRYSMGAHRCSMRSHRHSVGAHG